MDDEQISGQLPVEMAAQFKRARPLIVAHLKPVRCGRQTQTVARQDEQSGRLQVETSGSCAVASCIGQWRAEITYQLLPPPPLLKRRIN